MSIDEQYREVPTSVDVNPSWAPKGGPHRGRFSSTMGHIIYFP